MNGFIKKISLLAFLTLSSGDAASTISSRAGQYSVDGMKVFVVKQDEMTFGVSEDVPKNSDFFVKRLSYLRENFKPQKTANTHL